jgi:hypothetical protein
LQMRVFSALTVSFSLPMSLRIQCNASSALPLCTGSRDRRHRSRSDCRGFVLVRASPTQHKPAHVEIRQQRREW